MQRNLKRKDGRPRVSGKDLEATGIPNVLRWVRKERPGPDHLFTMREGHPRPWDPRRSKLAAFILKGVEDLPFQEGSHVLYLGAASGTTASHVADICPEGMIYCVEFSKRSFRDLIKTCEMVDNMVPILGNARNPHEYAPLVGQVDIVYQDLAQRDQAQIFLRNLRAFARSPKYEGTGNGILMIKSRSIDVARTPKEVYDEVLKVLRPKVKVLDKRVLDPFEKDHMAVLVKAR